MALIRAVHRSAGYEMTPTCHDETRGIKPASSSSVTQWQAALRRHPYGSLAHNDSTSKEDPLRIQPSNNTQVRLDLKRIPLFYRTIWEPGSLHRNRQVRSLQVCGINKPLVSVIVAKNLCDRYLRCQLFAEGRSLTGDCTRASVIELPEKHIGRVGVVVPRLPAEWVDDITKFAVLPDDSRELLPWATEEAGTLIVGTRHTRLIKDVERRRRSTVATVSSDTTCTDSLNIAGVTP
ncbi:hypothetical protein PsorP6_003203 [Peronosclerospora sorghi]|uniref:Uncharacterized protein n=1 Tax=Peronosclerospora sorghi TaxID=230839 RepID=A0ACC0VRC1_9STRA|nr:hypothetical protein PsorP6_003203 [Peronosclerospora sorghi]